jgi:hypothetical protein
MDFTPTCRRKACSAITAEIYAGSAGCYKFSAEQRNASERVYQHCITAVYGSISDNFAGEGRGKESGEELWSLRALLPIA